MQLFQQFYTAGPNGLWIFLLVSVVMGGSTAYVSGRAIADTWRPLWHAFVYALTIALGVRFIHFALFDELLVSGRNYLADCIICCIAAYAGYALARRHQMQRQYSALLGKDAAPKVLD